MANYENLPAGTYLRNGLGVFIRLVEPMRGDWAHVEKVRVTDGERDLRTLGWTGSLNMDAWHIATRPGRASSGGSTAPHPEHPVNCDALDMGRR